MKGQAHQPRSTSKNELSGTIPPELGKLTKELLESAELGTSPTWELYGLSGTIPSELGKLTNLKELHLTNNELSGTIPSELGKLTTLEVLGIFGNELSGTIPSELGNQLKVHLWDNLRNTVRVLTNLKELHFSQINDNGTIP